MTWMNKAVAGWMRLAALAVLAFAGASAQAAVPPGTIFDSTMLVTSPSLTTTTLNIASAGTLKVTLTDLEWPQAMESLSFALTNSSGVLASQTGTGLLTYAVSGPMTLFASIFAVPGAAADAGLYYVNVSFSSSTAPVPLPAAGWLLLSGMAGLAGLRRKRTTVTNPVV